MHNLIIRVLCTALVVSLAACGGGGGGGSGGSPTPTSAANNPPVITQGASTSVSMSENSTPTAFSLSLDAPGADNNTLTWSISTVATHGMASASGTGTSKAVGYTPNTGYVGPDSFDVQVSDGNGGTASITVNVTVTNIAPSITEGASTSVSMSVNSTPTAFNLTLHGSDVNGDTLTWSVSTAATHGTASASGTGNSIAVSYSPNSNYIGNDSFVVQVADGHGGTASITVNVTVTNDNPVITQGASTSVSMSENHTPTAFSLTLDATDANHDPLTWSLGATAAQHGTPTVSGTGASPVVGYTPTADYVGTDSFDVQVSDNHGGTATITVNVTVTNNSVAISVDAGPDSTATYNRPYVSVTICDTTPTCQTIDHILVDTGAVGLRILASALTLTLPPYNDSSIPGNTLGECYPLASGNLWGTLRLASVQMAGESTSNSIPIQVINDPAVAPGACTGNLGSIAALKANGILGVGYFKQDCGTACESASNVYYTCTDAADSATCSAQGVPTANQVPNPVSQFGLNWNGVSDNNGVIVSLPAINSAGEANVSGTLTFGVNTQTNNQLGSATVLTVDNPTGLLPTQFNGQLLCNSAIDSGSNNLNFPQGTIGAGNDFDTPPLCTSPGNTNFYCPTSPSLVTSIPATIGGLNGGAYAMVNFDVANTDGLSGSFTAFNDIAAKLDTFAATSIPGCTGTTGSFIWGLPFFFGKNVFVVFEGETVDSSTGPFIAF